MNFAFYGLDKPGALQLRLDTRPTHLEHLKNPPAGVVVRVASPQLDEEGKPKGSLVVFEAPDLAAAQAFCDADPYAKVDLFASTEIIPLNDAAFSWP